MLIKKLYGLETYLSNFIKLFDNNKLPKVLMLTGKKGQGKFTLVIHLLNYIFDKNNYDLENYIISNKSDLYSSIKENSNVNIIYFNCIQNNVKIDDIRNLKSTLQKSSINRFKRFIIFDDVEHLNKNCINALLKAIEEPSTNNYFILINNQRQNVLETLTSRSIEFVIFLNNLTKIDIIKKLVSDLNIEDKIDIKNSKLTPGNYLEFNKFTLDENININDELILNLEKILKLHKQKKNINYLNFAIYLIDKYYYNKSKNSLDINQLNNQRIKIIKNQTENNLNFHILDRKNLKEIINN